MTETITTQKAAARLLNFVKSHDPVARILDCDDDEVCVMVIRPELNLYDNFILLCVSRSKSKLLIHDGGLTLNGLNDILESEDLSRINAVLAEYGVDPLTEDSYLIQVRTSRAGYPERREALCRAIVALEEILKPLIKVGG